MYSKLDSLMSHFDRTGLLCGVVDVLSKRIFFALCEKSGLSNPVWNRVEERICLSPSSKKKTFFEKFPPFQTDQVIGVSD